MLDTIRHYYRKIPDISAILNAYAEIKQVYQQASEAMGKQPKLESHATNFARFSIYFRPLDATPSYRHMAGYYPRQF